MKKSKYCVDTAVTWSVILKALEMRVNYSLVRFKEDLWDFQNELAYKVVNQERADYFKHFVLSWCTQVFYWYEALCALRQFLGMRYKTPEQLDIKQCYEFFGQYGGTGEDTL